MRRWNLPQVNTKVMCAVLTAAMVMTGFTACAGSTSASAQESTTASEEQDTLAAENTESGEEKVETYLGQITAIDGNVISIALAEQPELPDGQAPDSNGQAPNGEAPSGEAPAKPDGEAPTGEAPNGNGQAPDDNGQAPSGEAPAKPDGEAPTGEAPNGNGQAPNGEAPAKPDGEVATGEAPSGQQPEKDMLDNMELKLSGDTMTITVNDDTIITIDGKEATLDDIQVGDTVSFFLDGETVTSLSVGMPENAGMPEQPAPQDKQPTSQDPTQEQKSADA